MVTEMFSRRNDLVGKCLDGEISIGEVSGWGIVRSGKCPSGICPQGNVSRRNVHIPFPSYTKKSFVVRINCTRFYKQFQFLFYPKVAYGSMNLQSGSCLEVTYLIH